jgi:hypothetical protein
MPPWLKFQSVAQTGEVTVASAPSPDSLGCNVALTALASDDERRYPDDALAQILLEGWGDSALQKEILRICLGVLALPQPRNGVPQQR